MKKLFQKNKVKIISISLASIIIMGSIVSLIYIANINKSSSTFEDNDGNNFIDEIDLSTNIKQKHLYLLIDKNNKKFSNELINKNIINVFKNILNDSNISINGNLNNYLIKILYNLNIEKTILKINLFLIFKKLNKIKYKSFFKISLY